MADKPEFSAQEQMSKSKLIEWIVCGHGVFKAMLAELSPEQMLLSGVIGDWSVKDILMHIVVHEQRMLDWLEERLRGSMPETPQPYDMQEDELAVLNRQIHLENMDNPLDDALYELDRLNERALGAVIRAAEADLIDSSRFCLKNGEPLWEAVAANTYEHYEEHSRDIRAWLEKQRADPSQLTRSSGWRESTS